LVRCGSTLEVPLIYLFIYSFFIFFESCSGLIGWLVGVVFVLALVWFIDAGVYVLLVHGELPSMFCVCEISILSLLSTIGLYKIRGLM